MKNIGNKPVILLLLLSLLAYTVPAQDLSGTIEGTVTDIYGKPVKNVQINSGKGKNGTSTGIDGKYSLAVEDGSEFLIFSKRGYFNNTVPVTESGVVDVVLSYDIHQQDEVVEMGYGTQLRKRLVGAVSTVTGDELERAPVANLTQTLPGRLPGVTTLEIFSELSRANTGLVVRGFSTARNLGPLVIVDGVLVPYQSNETLEYITPSEIESISVLKDASAQAMYGILGANGLFVVKTKRGQKGKLNIRVRLDQSVQQVTTKPVIYDAATYATLKNLAAANDGTDLPYTSEAIEMFRSGANPELYPNNNWYNMFYRDLARMERASINFSGGSDRVQYYTNLNIMHQGGYFKTEQPRYNANPNNTWINFRSNVDMNITSYLKAFIRLSGNIKRERTPGGAGNQDVYSSLFTLPPDTYGPLTPPVLHPDTGEVLEEGQVVTNQFVGAPTYGLLNRSGYVNHTVTNITSQFGVSVDLAKGLSLTGTFAYQTNAVGSLRTTQNFERYMRDMTNPSTLVFIKKGEELNTPLAYSKGHQSYYHLTSNVQLDYHKTFGKHTVDALGFFFYQNLTKADLASPGLFPYNRIHTGGQVSYGYDDRYFLYGSAGISGSEQYARHKRYTTTPSVGIGWLLSNERFLKEVNWLSNAKLRASYGKTANDQNGLRRFMYLDQIRSQSGGPLGYLQYLVIEEQRGNPDIRAEVVTKSNAGIDLGFFNALSISVDVFKERIDNMLVSAISTIPAYQGIPLEYYPHINIGKFENKGYEVAVQYKKHFSKDWSAYLGGNLSYNRNTQIMVDEPELTPDYAYRKQREGYSVGQEFGFLVDYSNGNGFFNTQEEIDNYGIEYSFSNRIRLGDLKYQDLNGDGIIDDRDRAPIGTGAIPRYVYGISFGASYRSFELHALFQGIGKFSSIYTGAGVFETSFDGLYGSLHAQSWTPERYAAGEPITYPALSRVQSANHQVSDFFNYDRSFVRLKNLELSYELPLRVSRLIAADKIRVLLSGQNLVTWDKMKTKDFGPEGGNFLQFPVYKVYNVGLSVTF